MALNVAILVPQYPHTKMHERRQRSNTVGYEHNSIQYAQSLYVLCTRLLLNLIIKYKDIDASSAPSTYDFELNSQH